MAVSCVPVLLTSVFTLLVPPDSFDNLTCSSISTRVPSGARSSPHYEIVIELAKPENGPILTLKISVYPLSIRLLAIVPPTLHVRQK